MVGLHVGEESIANNGLKMKIIAWRKKNDIDIEFEDKIVVYNKTYQNFKGGKIKHPNHDTYSERFQKRIGETNIASNGQLMTIIDYDNARGLTVQFDDGFTKEEVSYRDFKKGYVKNPNKVVKFIQNKDIASERVNESYTYNGVQYSIERYINASEVYVRASDIGLLKVHYSTFKEHKELGQSIRCEKSMINQVYKTNSGVLMVVKEYKDARNVLVEFEDGTEKTLTAYQIQNGWGYKLNKNSRFGNFRINSKSGAVGNDVFYTCICEKCGYKDILTPSEMLAHKCKG